jgi:hypothetical protein
MRIHPFHAGNPLNSFVLKNIAAKPINGIRWVNNHASTQQAVNDGFNLPGLGIIGMYMDQHRSSY